MDSKKSSFPWSITPGRILRLSLVALVIMLSLYLIFSNDSGILQIRKLRQERDQLREEVQQLQSESEKLHEQIQRLEEADSFVIEEEARLKGMVREGEEVYRLDYKEKSDTLLLKRQEESR